jgi:hypothetical protein
MRSVRDLDEVRLGRLLVAIGLVGFGIENILFGRYIVARHAPWPPIPRRNSSSGM